MGHQFYMAIKGQKQGDFKGEATDARRRGKWTELLSFRYGAEPPFDANSRLPAGRRSHQPLTITKEEGSASPQLLQAHWSREMLDEVAIEIVGRPSGGSGEVVVERITLTNATISHHSTYVPVPTGHPEPQKHSNFLQDFTFEYGAIQVRNH